MAKEKLFALLVGINEYQYVRGLNGCVNDIRRVKKFIRRRLKDDYDAEITELLDEDATRDAILSSFEKMFKAAAGGAQTLFYFSGHGGLEDTPSALVEAGARPLLETLVAVDSRGPGIPGVSDKEIRWLMHKYAGDATGDKIVMITDSCHSGDVTRSLAPDDGDYVARLATGVSKRRWNEFVFHDDIKASEMRKSTLAEMIPERPHVHMAACLSSESAYEVGGKGVFTSRLLDLLDKSPGGVTYANLIGRIRLGLHRCSKPQTPNLKLDDLNNYSFLGSKPTAYPQLDSAEVIYNPSERKWCIERGAIHGLAQFGDEELKVQVGDIEGTLIVGIDKSEVIFPKSAKLNKENAHKAKIPGFITRILRVGVAGDADKVKALEKALKKIVKSQDAIEITEQPQDSDLVVVAEGDIISYTWPDFPLPPEPVVPLVKQFKGEVKNISKEVLLDLRQIADYMHVRDIRNHDAKNKEFPLTFEVIAHKKDGSKSKLPLKNGDPMVLQMPYTKVSGQKYGFKLINNTDQPLFGAVVYLSQEFGSITTIPGSNMELGPREEVELFDKEIATSSMGDHISQFNFPKELFYYKVFYSTTPFDVGALHLESMEYPGKGSYRVLDKEKDTIRGMAFKKEVSEPDAWGTILIRAESPNPDYDKAKISVYIADEAGRGDDSDTQVPCPEEQFEWDAVHEFRKESKIHGFVEPDLNSSYEYEDHAGDESAEGDDERGLAKPSLPPCGTKQDYLTTWPRPAVNDAWHLNDDRSQLKKAREIAMASRGRPVRIAHFDTGYDPNHPSRPEKIIRERNFIKGEDQDSAVDPYLAKPLSMPGHGTGTIGILAGGKVKLPDSDFHDYLGGASFAEIVPCRIANSVILLKAKAFAEALEWVTDQYDDPATRIDIITMSMGGLASRRWRDAVSAAYEKGIFIVTAAGNHFATLPTNTVIYPARFNRVMAAAGVNWDHKPYHRDHYDRKSSIMQGCYGPKKLMNHAIAAYTPNVPWPRIGCKDTPMGGDGTSSATPQVAAAAACYLQHHVEKIDALEEGWKRVEAIRYALKKTAYKVPDEHDSDGISLKFGHGVIRVADALEVPVDESKLEKADKDKLTVPFLRMVFRTRDLSDDEPSAEDQMFEMECLQLMQRSPRLQKLFPDGDIDQDNMDTATIKKYCQALADEPLASAALRAKMSEILMGLE